MQAWILANPFEGLKDVVIAYCSLTIIYDPNLVKKRFRPVSTVFELVRYILEEAYHHADIPATDSATLIRIPVCYDNTLGTDLDAIATKKQLTVPEIIHLHTTPIYRVYMIGFLPGFPYLAEVDQRLVLPRKTTPVPVHPGSVGIAGPQTGIYPFNSPGGWHIVGRTNMKLFDPASEGISTLKAGDHVQFYAISKEEFNDIA